MNKSEQYKIKSIKNLTDSEEPVRFLNYAAN